MIFFVMGMYLRMSETMYTRVLSDTGSVVYYVFILLLGLALAKSSGKIASAVISGQPALGVGDIANQMRTWGHMAHTAEHAAHQAQQDMHNIGQKGQKVGREAAMYNANRDAADFSARKAAQEAKKTLAQKAASGEYATGMHSSDPAERAAARKQVAQQMKDVGNEAYKNAMKSSMSEYNKDRMYSALTGGMVRNAGKDGSFGKLIIGQDFIGKDGNWHKATYNDVQERNEELRKLAGEKTISQYLKEKEEEGKRNVREKDRDWPEVGL